MVNKMTDAKWVTVRSVIAALEMPWRRHFEVRVGVRNFRMFRKQSREAKAKRNGGALSQAYYLLAITDFFNGKNVQSQISPRTVSWE